MIVAHTFGPAWGVPDPSPFCIKLLTLLKLSGVSYERVNADFTKAPKGKTPWIVDDGTVVPDTFFIRRHLETQHGVDFDGDLSARDRATGHALERLCEEHLYWTVVHERWMIPANFEVGPRHFFKGMPAPVRAVAIPIIKRQVKRDLRGQGLGRHTRDEILEVAGAGIDTLAVMLGDGPYLFGETPKGADASVFAFLCSALVERFDTPLIALIARHPNLMAYHDLMMEEFFPEFSKERKPAADDAHGTGD